MSYCKAINCYEERNSYFYTDYCSYHRDCLDKLFAKTDELWYGNDKIHKMETFETWFNKNCGYIVTYNCFSSFISSLYIIIYEPAVGLMDENWAIIKYDRDLFCFTSFSKAEKKALEIKEELTRDRLHDTPMLEVHPKVNSYEYFSSLITNPYVIKKDIPHRHEPGFWSDTFWAPVNAENYFKPLDIVWVGRRDTGIPFYHVGIYLGKGNEGKNWICHLNDDEGAKITDWKSFLKAGRCEEIIRYHPIIPFKNYSKIAKKIAWAVDGTPYREGNYNLANRNCEHFANMVVYGINYSKQEDRKDELIAKNIGLTVAFPIPALIFNNYSINNGKGSAIKLTNEMSESNDKLGWITNDWSRWIENKVQQEVPPKQNCKIM